jgi:hypothetical protein
MPASPGMTVVQLSWPLTEAAAAVHHPLFLPVRLIPRRRVVHPVPERRLDPRRFRPGPAPHGTPRGHDRTQSSLTNATNSSPTAGSSPERRSMSCQDRIARNRAAALRSPRPAAAWHSAAARANSAAAPDGATRFRRLTPHHQANRRRGPQPASAGRSRPPRQLAAAGKPKCGRPR